MLYEKYRPQKFEDVLGQGETTNILKKQVITGNIAHTYLLEGNRGSGKTTSARILAKAINCKNPVDGNPCGCCDSCTSIAKGTNLDVVEIDAASNNGVDTVRDIISNMQYSPDAKYKVYIIDEAHMLSKSAFNAFLKTLEEPPKYGVFILCTTEKSNLPITIISRCQQYKFKNIEPLVIESHLKAIATKEGFVSNDLDKISNLISIKADGAMRDALCLLEQVINSNLSYDALIKLIGFTGDAEVKNLAYQAFMDNSIKTLFNMGDIDVINVVEGLVKTFRDIVIYRVAGAKSLNVSESELNLIDKLSNVFKFVSNNTLNEIINLLSLRYNDILNSKFKFTLLEMTMIAIEDMLSNCNKFGCDNTDTAEESEIVSKPVQNDSVDEPSNTENYSEPITQHQEDIVGNNQEITEPIEEQSVEEVNEVITITPNMINDAKNKMIEMLKGANRGQFDSLIIQLINAQFFKVAKMDSILIVGEKVDVIKAHMANEKMLSAMMQFFKFDEKQLSLVLDY